MKVNKSMLTCLAKIARANYPAEQAAPEATTLLFSNEKDVQS